MQNGHSAIYTCYTAGEAGIVTTSVPLMMADGVEYRYIWARQWRETPQSEEPKTAAKRDGEFEYATLVGEPFRGLLAVGKSGVEVALPWEIVRGWAKCDRYSGRKDIYGVGDSD